MADNHEDTIHTLEAAHYARTRIHVPDSVRFEILGNKPKQVFNTCWAYSDQHKRQLKASYKKLWDENSEDMTESRKEKIKSMREKDEGAFDKAKGRAKRASERQEYCITKDVKPDMDLTNPLHLTALMWGAYSTRGLESKMQPEDHEEFKVKMFQFLQEKLGERQWKTLAPVFDDRMQTHKGGDGVVLVDSIQRRREKYAACVQATFEKSTTDQTKQDAEALLSRLADRLKSAGNRLNKQAAEELVDALSNQIATAEREIEQWSLGSN